MTQFLWYIARQIFYTEQLFQYGKVIRIAAGGSLTKKVNCVRPIVIFEI